MGPYLTVPNKTKESEDGSNSIVFITLSYFNCLQLEFGASCMQGWRNTQEDAHICALDIEGGGCLFAVFDGHGGINIHLHTMQ